MLCACTAGASVIVKFVTTTCQLQISQFGKVIVTILITSYVESKIISPINFKGMPQRLA